MTSNSKETARQVFERLIAEHPDRFVEAPKTGEGFVILGARQPTSVAMKKKMLMSDRLVHWIEHFCRRPSGLRKGDRVVLSEDQFERIEKIYDAPVRAEVIIGGKLAAYLALAHLAGPAYGEQFPQFEVDSETMWEAASSELQQFLTYDRERHRISFMGKPISDEGPRAA
jgi:hypothetical protein